MRDERERVPDSKRARFIVKIRKYGLLREKDWASHLYPSMCHKF